MSQLPQAVSPRMLFKLWYSKLDYRQRRAAVQDFRRFVTVAETVARLEAEWDSSPSCVGTTC